MKQWYQKQLRMVQTVLRETDIINYDAEAVVKYLEDSDANVIIVNAGGIVDFFHSGLEGANLNPFMKEGQDILKDLTEKCHAKGIKVICRIDFRGAERPFFEKHPDWFSSHEDGSVMRMSEMAASISSRTEIYLPCYNGRYMNDHAAAFLRSLFAQYDIDGIWENAVGIPYGVCHCTSCQEKYRKETGRELPTDAEMKNPAVYEEYRKFKYRSASEHIRYLRNVVKEQGEEKAYAAEVWGFYRTNPPEQINVLDLDMGRENFDFFVTPAMVSQDADVAGYPSGLSYPGSIVKHMKMISPDKQAVHLFGNNGGTLRYVHDPEAENRIFLWETVSAGGGFWNCLFNGMHPAATHDNRAAYISRPMFRFLKDNEGLLEDSFPAADVAIYASKPTRDLFGNAGDISKDRFCFNMKGFEKLLVEQHVQFVHFPGDVNLKAEDLKPFKAVILPNAAAMSEGEAEAFRQYVKEGGRILATFETGLYDENGKRRADFALSDVLGVTATSVTANTSRDCYQLIRDRQHPLMKGTEGTELLANAEQTLLVRTLDGVRTATTYIPIIPNQPPEKAWTDSFETDYPVASSHTFGKGEAFYFAFPIGKALFRYAHDDFVLLAANAVEELLGGSGMVETDAPRSVHVQAIYTGENKDGMMLSFVNHTGTMYRPVREVVPVHDFTARLKLPKEAAAASVLYGGENVQVSVRSDGAGAPYAEVRIGLLKDFASAAVRFA